MRQTPELTVQQADCRPGVGSPEPGTSRAASRAGCRARLLGLPEICSPQAASTAASFTLRGPRGPLRLMARAGAGHQRLVLCGSRWPYSGWASSMYYHREGSAPLLDLRVSSEVWVAAKWQPQAVNCDRYLHGVWTGHVGWQQKWAGTAPAWNIPVPPHPMHIASEQQTPNDSSSLSSPILRGHRQWSPALLPRCPGPAHRGSVLLPWLRFASQGCLS